MNKFKLDFDLLNKTEIGKIIKGSIIPRPIAWITSLNETKSINLAPFSYFTILSPTLLLISFQKNQTKQKDTFLNIIREKEAVIHIVDESLIETMDKTAKPLKINDSEVDLTNLILTSSLKIKTPGIRKALIRFEVTLEQTLSLMNYEKTEEEANVVILRVVAAILDEEIYDNDSGYILANKLKPVGRLAGADYTGINKLDFKRRF